MEVAEGDKARFSLKKLPMGYRFLPTDEELVVYYLINKAFYRPLPAEVIPDIREREFYSSPPSDLDLLILDMVDKKLTTLKLPSGEVRLISKNCSTVGQSDMWEMLGADLSVVRGVVMNPVDHPHRSGEGRAPIGRKKPTTPWGYPALGRRSRKRNKYSDNLILHRRSK
uniref:NAC domain-containing protein n=1 Tax=Vitis vinifera TaxID=29760 RepID=F6GT24_VITVI